MLFEVYDTTQPVVSHKGVHKDGNNVKACLKIWNECGEDIPRFVSHYLDELLMEITNMKQAAHLQAVTSDRVASGLARTEDQVPSDVKSATLLEHSREKSSLPKLPLWSLVAKRG